MKDSRYVSISFMIRSYRDENKHIPSQYFAVPTVFIIATLYEPQGKTTRSKQLYFNTISSIFPPATSLSIDESVVPSVNITASYLAYTYCLYPCRKYHHMAKCKSALQGLR